jgi:hypothetical protein
VPHNGTFTIDHRDNQPSADRLLVGLGMEADGNGSDRRFLLVQADDKSFVCSCSPTGGVLEPEVPVGLGSRAFPHIR